MKPESEWDLEDWVTYHTAKCNCSGHFQCCGCTIKDLQESWKRTLQVERSMVSALRRALDKARVDAPNDNSPERP